MEETFGKTQRFWIGITDEGDEGNWRWVTDEPVKYTNWSRHGLLEPNNMGSGEHFGHTNWMDGTWNDLGPRSSEWGSTRSAIIERAPEM
ncbi:MAG: lectin-like protein [Candidatus Poribacteria bacterium]|nr:lectin-like protein [Candidatus Poribacteria bacterium]